MAADLSSEVCIWSVDTLSAVILVSQQLPCCKKEELSQIYLPYNQFLLPYKRSIFTIKVAKMIWFLEKSTLYPDLPYKRLPYK